MSTPGSLNKRLVRSMDNAFYSKYQNNWDDKLLREQILALIKPNDVILDVGAGRGLVTEMNFRGLVRKVVGVDPDPRVKENPMLDEGHEGLGDDMPYLADNTFDIVFCDNVLEHVEHPGKFYKEVSRVLKPGGLFISKTPNKYYYVAIIAAITPHWFHEYVNRKRGRNDSDTFHTFYRANTRKDQARWSRESGLKIESSRYVEGRPEYLRMFAFTYVGGLIFERVINLFRLNGLKAILITVCKKAG